MAVNTERWLTIANSATRLKAAALGARSVTIHVVCAHNKQHQAQTRTMAHSVLCSMLFSHLH